MSKFNDSDFIKQDGQWTYFKYFSSSIRYLTKNIKKVSGGYEVVNYSNYETLDNLEEREKKREERRKIKEEMKSWSKEQWDEYYTKCDLERERRKQIKNDNGFYESLTMPRKDGSNES